MSCKTDLPLRAQADIEARLEKIYKMAVLLYPTMFFPGVPGLDPLLPYTRKAATLKLEFQRYAMQLFGAEAQEYPKLPDASSNMSAWLDALRVCVENDVISHQRQRGRMWTLHCSEEEARQAIREALKDISVGVPDQPQHTEQIQDVKLGVPDRKTNPNIPLTLGPGTLTSRPDAVAMERTTLLTTFKAKGRNARIKITDEMVAKASNPGRWNDRTMVTWWKRNDPRCKPVYDKKIRAVLAREPASIWPVR